MSESGKSGLEAEIERVREVAEFYGPDWPDPKDVAAIEAVCEAAEQLEGRTDEVRRANANRKAEIRRVEAAEHRLRAVEEWARINNLHPAAKHVLDLLSHEPVSTECPTCGSDNPMKRPMIEKSGRGWEVGYPCPDSFHRPPPSEPIEPRAGSLDPLPPRAGSLVDTPSEPVSGEGE